MILSPEQTAVTDGYNRTGTTKGLCPSLSGTRTDDESNCSDDEDNEHAEEDGAANAH